MYQPYPRPNRALVKVLYISLRKGLITLSEWAAMMRVIMGDYQR